MKRRTPLLVLFRAGNLGATYPSADADLNALPSGTHGALDGSFNGTAVIDTRFDLFCNLFANNVGIEFRFPDFKDVDLNIFARQYLQLFFDEVNFLTALADDDARPAGVDGDGNPLQRALDCNSGNAVLNRFVALTWIRNRRFRATCTKVGANFFVLHDLQTVVFVGIPVGIPTADNAQAVTDRICFLTHYL
jgi:hypothetical protein